MTAYVAAALSPLILAAIAALMFAFHTYYMHTRAIVIDAKSDEPGGDAIRPLPEAIGPGDSVTVEMISYDGEVFEATFKGLAMGDDGVVLVSVAFGEMESALPLTRVYVTKRSPS